MNMLDGIITLLKVKATKSFFHVTSVDFNDAVMGKGYVEQKLVTEICQFAEMATNCVNPEGENNPKRVAPKDHCWPSIICGDFTERKKWNG